LALFGGGRLAETTSLNVILSAILFNISFLSDVVFGARAVLVLGEQSRATATATGSGSLFNPSESASA
jgi:hypothetical protein